MACDLLHLFLGIFCLFLQFFPWCQTVSIGIISANREKLGSLTKILILDQSLNFKDVIGFLIPNRIFRQETGGLMKIKNLSQIKIPII